MRAIFLCIVYGQFNSDKANMLSFLSVLLQYSDLQALAFLRALSVVTAKVLSV